MDYDVLKYHVVTTYKNRISSQNEINNQFKQLSNDSNFKVNFLYCFNSKRINQVIIDEKTFTEETSDYYKNYYREKPGWIGEIDSIIQCLNLARIGDWPYIFIFQDNIKIDKNFNELINKYLENIDNYSAILIGYYGHPKQELNDNLLICDKSITECNSILIKKEKYIDLLKLINCGKIISKKNWFLHIDNVYCLKNKLTSLRTPDEI